MIYIYILWYLHMISCMLCQDVQQLQGGPALFNSWCRLFTAPWTRWWAYFCCTSAGVPGISFVCEACVVLDSKLTSIYTYIYNVYIYICDYLYIHVTCAFLWSCCSMLHLWCLHFYKRLAASFKHGHIDTYDYRTISTSTSASIKSTISSH